MIHAPVSLGTASGAGTPLTITVSAAVPAGESIIILVTGRNAATITDSQGNTYAQDNSTSYSLGGPSDRYSHWSAHGVTALTSGVDTISVNGISGGVASCTVDAYLVKGIRARSGDGTYTYVASVNGLFGAGSSPFSSLALGPPGMRPQDSAIGFGLIAAFAASGASLSAVPSPWVDLGRASWRTGYASSAAVFPAFNRTITWPSGDAYITGLETVYPARTKALGLGKGADGRMMVAQAKLDGSLQALRYDDATPPALSSTVEVFAAGLNRAVGAALLCRRCGIWDLGEVRSINGRVEFDHYRSRNQGTTWTIGTANLGGSSSDNWGRVTACYDPGQGRHIFCVFEPNPARWVAFIGNPSGATWTYVNYSTSYVPNEVATSAGPSASLACRPDGALLFAYIDDSLNAKLRVCRNLTSLGVGSWIDAGLIDDGWSAIALLQTQQGPLLAALWDAATNLWSLALGTLDTGGADTYTWGAPVQIDGVEAWESGSLLQLGDGAVLFCYLAYASETVTILRNPSASGSGVWT